MRFRRKTNPIPDPGQRVRLLGWRGRPLRGRYRTISGPLTGPNSEVVIRVTEEREYREALGEGRRAVGITWPARKMEVVSEAPRADAREPETARRPWWVRWLGG